MKKIILILFALFILLLFLALSLSHKDSIFLEQIWRETATEETVGKEIKNEPDVNAEDNVKNKQEKINNAIQKFKDVIKTDNPKIIADYVVYPYKKRSPLPDIENKEDFIKNYTMVLDDYLKQVINDTTLEDWSKVGYHGIMLYQGLLWINNDGKLIAINYHTAKEHEYITKWYQNDNKIIHESLKQYDENICIFKTGTKLGRIDTINTDEHYNCNYRLALWDKNSDMSIKPEVLISDGTVKYFGTANNTEYHFKSGEYEYVFFINYVGPMDMVPYEFGTYKNATEDGEYFDYDKSISFEEASVIK